MVGVFGVLVLVWEPTWAPRTIEQPLPLRLWPVRQPPRRRPFADSNICTCGRIHNDRAGCGPVVHWSEQSLKKVTVRIHGYASSSGNSCGQNFGRKRFDFDWVHYSVRHLRRKLAPARPDSFASRHLPLLRRRSFMTAA
jgi:hypothetical protein